MCNIIYNFQKNHVILAILHHAVPTVRAKKWIIKLYVLVCKNISDHLRTADQSVWRVQNVRLTKPVWDRNVLTLVWELAEKTLNAAYIDTAHTVHVFLDLKEIHSLDALEDDLSHLWKLLHANLILVDYLQLVETFLVQRFVVVIQDI